MDCGKDRKNASRTRTKHGVNGGGRTEARKEVREDREREECQVRNGRKREKERIKERVRERGGEKRAFSLSLPPSSLMRAREGRGEAKEDAEYGKGGFAGKTLHGEGG